MLNVNIITVCFEVYAIIQDILVPRLITLFSIKRVFWSRILKKSIFLCAYFQNLDLQEYKIDQPKLFVMPINRI